MKRALFLLGAVLGLAGQLRAAAPVKAPATVKTGGPVSWRDRYLLGPGDVLNISAYGRPDLTRDSLTVQPDGTITYLQAQNIRAEGRTIDELRHDLETQLEAYYKHLRLIVAPYELRSKKYFLMGKVIDNGAFYMDRPTTILEAVARARGIATGLYQQNTVELADFEHSFLIRGNQRLPVDFRKLFFEGDMTQNLELEPGDYLYFPSSLNNELFVLGEINAPGVQGFTDNLTALGLIAQREGFSRKAYRERVLVIRGSMEKPQLIVVNTNDILKGKRADFRLQPKDIVFVASRPWQAAEELLDSALSGFAARWKSRSLSW